MMGTNYYFHTEDPCPTCGHNANEPIHIGKSSTGWCFSLHVYPKTGLPENLIEWINLFDCDGSSIIKDENEVRITIKEMIAVILCRWRFGGGYSSEGAVQGPLNLLRRRRDQGCIEHGCGTYDLVVGDFS